MNEKISIKIFVAAFASLLLPSLLLAIESGSGSIGPKKNQFSVSSLISQSEFDVYEYDNQESAGDSEIEERFIQLSYGLTDHLGASLRMGEMAWDPKSSNGGDYDFGPAWGIGVYSATPLPSTNPDLTLQLGWTFSYNWGKPENRTRNSGDIFDARIKEWQTGVDLSCAWKRIIGYGGFRYSQVNLIYTHDSHNGTRRGGFEEEDPFNLFLGGKVNLIENLFFRLELDFAGVNGAAAALTYEFDNPLADFGRYLWRRY